MDTPSAGTLVTSALADPSLRSGRQGRTEALPACKFWNYVFLVPLRELQKPDDVLICVFDRCNQLPPTEIFDPLLCLCASVYQ